jgi:hypothetical protein
MLQNLTMAIRLIDIDLQQLLKLKAAPDQIFVYRHDIDTTEQKYMHDR